MLDFLSKEGKTEEELRSFAKKYWSLAEVRKWFITYYINKEEWRKAVSLLHKSLEKDKEYPGFVSMYKKQLKEIQPKASNQGK